MEGIRSGPLSVQAQELQGSLQDQGLPLESCSQLEVLLKALGMKVAPGRSRDVAVGVAIVGE